MSIASAYKPDDLIPVAAWGRDHWSLLGYIETVIEAMGDFQVGFDARMRQNRRNFRVMENLSPRPRRINHTPASLGVTMDVKYASRLLDGSQPDWTHDDWCCVQDMVTAGFLFNCSNGQADIEPLSSLKFTAEGVRVAQALRLHKMNGGTFSNFDATKVLLEGAA